MPPTQIEFYYRYESLNGIVNLGHREKSFWMRHETNTVMSLTTLTMARASDLVILSNIDLGSSMKVGKTTLLRSAPGRSCEMIWERTSGFNPIQ